MQAFAYDYGTYYQLIVTDGTETNTFSFNFSKDQDIQKSLNEANLLAQTEMDKRAAPKPVAL